MSEFVTPGGYRILLLPGDGVGPEVMEQGRRVLEAVASGDAGLNFEFATESVGAREYLKSGDPLPERALASFEEADAVLLAAMGLPEVRWPDGREMTPQIDLRERFDLYTGLRPIKLYHPDDSPLKGFGTDRSIDIMLVRENTEGLFSARLNQQPEDRSESRDVMRITRAGAERICHAAFAQAQQRRQRCTLVDKANVLPSMVFLREIFNEVGEQYPAVARECVYVDAMALYLVRKPDAYDVVVTENMFGDILSDLAAGLVGGMGMAPSADVGDRYGVFQPSHGSAPDIAGQGLANPVAMILSAAMMCAWLGEQQASDRIESAVSRTLADPGKRTPDMGGKLSTAEMADAILAEL